MGSVKQYEIHNSGGFVDRTIHNRRNEKVDKMITVVKCWNCENSHEITTTEAAWKAWKSGELIQDAMPELSAGDRELLISGTCGECFDEMFPAVDDDEDIWAEDES